MEQQLKADAEGLKATKYVLGDAETDGHTHYFYLRDDLPIATTNGYKDVNDRVVNHAHSIKEGPDNTVICEEAAGHTHTVLKIEEAGSYKPRTMGDIPDA